MAERAASTWSLARRLTGLYLVSIGGFVLAIAGASTVFLNRAVSSEVDALVREEIDEAGALSRGAPRFDPVAFTRIVQDLQREHPENGMGWRVWPAEGGEPLDFGQRRLLRLLPPSAEPGTAIVRGGRDLRSITARLDDGSVAALVLDGAAQYRLLRTYEIAALVVVAGCLLAGLLMARVVFRRVSSLLADVARQARAVQEPDHPPQVRVDGAPVEILEIVDALRDLMDRTRREADAARLFTAGLAHELRAPVQNLIGETEVALLSDRDGDAYRRLLHSHLDELRSLGDAVDNLVTICSRGEDRRAGARENFDLAEEAELRLRRDRSLADRCGIRLTLEARGDTRIAGDREAILRALRNLVQNAIQWSPPGGEVRLCIEGRDEAVDVTVDDSGPGVPADWRAAIFEPFVRGPSARGRRVGYGLGLALVRGAAQDHGGEVEVGASPLGGARFRLVLPRRAA